jgi:hypothetical protein
MIGDEQDTDINRRLDELEARDYRGELDDEGYGLHTKGGYSQSDDDVDPDLVESDA